MTHTLKLTLITFVLMLVVYGVFLRAMGEDGLFYIFGSGFIPVIWLSGRVHDLGFVIYAFMIVLSQIINFGVCFTIVWAVAKLFEKGK
jgi:hypothetical protein